MRSLTTTSAVAKASLTVSSGEKVRSQPRLSGRLVWTLGLSAVEALDDIGDRRQRLVVHLDRLGSVDGQFAVFGKHDRDWLALEGHLLIGQRKPVRDGVFLGDESRRDRMEASQQRLEVGVGQHGDHARHRFGGGGIDAGDARVGVRAAHDRHRQRAWADQVLDVLPVAGDQVRIFAAMDFGANHLADSHALCPPVGLDAGQHRRSCRYRSAGHLHGLDDVRVAGAAAQVAFQTLADLLLGRVRIALQQGGRGHQEARCAEAALQAVLTPEGFLQGLQLAVLGQAFDGGQLAPIRLDGEQGARLDWSVVDEDRCTRRTGWCRSRRAFPVKPRSSRRKYTSKSRGSTSRVYVVPFTPTLTVLKAFSAICPSSMRTDGTPRWPPWRVTVRDLRTSSGTNRHSVLGPLAVVPVTICRAPAVSIVGVAIRGQVSSIATPTIERLISQLTGVRSRGT